MSSTVEVDVLIVGGGILGLSAAHHLAHRGFQTIVVERETEVARHASGKGAGMIRHLYRHPQLTEWTLRSIASLQCAIPDLELERTGSIIVGRRVPSHHIDLFREFTLRRDDGKAVPAVFTQADGLVNPTELTQAVFRGLLRQGVEVRLGETVTGISPVNDSWTVETSTATLRARWVINAAGAWLNQFLSGRIDVPATRNASPYVRHLFVLSGFPQGSLPDQPDLHAGFYWDEIGEWYLRHWARASRLFSICDKQPADPDRFAPSAEIEQELKQKLHRCLPFVAEQLDITRSWFCFRTYTEDQLPLWGPDDEYPSFFWLAAFGGYGISTGFAAAEDAARFIAGERVDVPREFLPARAKVELA